MKSLNLLIIFQFLFHSYCVADFDNSALNLIYEWNFIEYIFPTQADENLARTEGRYDTNKITLIDCQPYYTVAGLDKVFVTAPRSLNYPVPATLGIVVESQNATEKPKIKPYPDYSWHVAHGTNCLNMTSIFRTTIDRCNRLFAIDTGRIQSNQVCPPTIWAFDLTTNELIRRYPLPTNQWKSGISFFVNIMVEVGDESCNDTFVYAADEMNFAIIVYDWQNNESWRTYNQLFWPEPGWGTVAVGGISDTYEFMGGLVGMSIFYYSNMCSSDSSLNEPLVFFSAFSSNSLNTVPLSILKDKTGWLASQDYSPRSFIKIGDKDDTTIPLAIDSKGNIFFNEMRKSQISCWNGCRQKPYKANTIKGMVQDTTRLQYVNGLKVVVSSKTSLEELWILSDRNQEFRFNRFNPNVTNFRIFSATIEDFIGGNKKRC